MILIPPPSIEERWQSMVWLFIPLFSATPHSYKTSLKWRLVQRDSERDGKLHRKNSIGRNQNIQLCAQVFFPNNNRDRNKWGSGRKSKTASGGFAPMWYTGVERDCVTDVLPDTVWERVKSAKSLRLPKVRVTVMLCLFLYISGTPYVTVLPHFTVIQTDGTQLKRTHIKVWYIL